MRIRSGVLEGIRHSRAESCLNAKAEPCRTPGQRSPRAQVQSRQILNNEHALRRAGEPGAEWPSGAERRTPALRSRSLSLRLCAALRLSASEARLGRAAARGQRRAAWSLFARLCHAVCQTCGHLDRRVDGSNRLKRKEPGRTQLHPASTDFAPFLCAKVMLPEEAGTV